MLNSQKRVISLSNLLSFASDFVDPDPDMRKVKLKWIRLPRSCDSFSDCCCSNASRFLRSSSSIIRCSSCNFSSASRLPHSSSRTRACNCRTISSSFLACRSSSRQVSNCSRIFSNSRIFLSSIAFWRNKVAVFSSANSRALNWKLRLKNLKLFRLWYHASVPVFPAQAEFLSDPANLRAKPCDYLPPPRVLFPLALPISSCLEGTSDNERVPPHSQLPPWMHSPTAIESDDRWLEIRRFFGSRITGTCYDAWTRGSSTGTWKWSPEWFPLGIARRWEFHRVFPSLMYPNRRPKPVKVTRWKHNSIKLVSWNYA